VKKAIVKIPSVTRRRRGQFFLHAYSQDQKPVKITTHQTSKISNHSSKVPSDLFYDEID
jgi:hypothetical protein